MMDSLTETSEDKKPWQMMFADDVVLCVREKDVMELELEQWREAIRKERNESVMGKERIHVSKCNAIRKCSYVICPAATGHRIQLSGKNPAERWWHE